MVRLLVLVAVAACAGCETDDARIDRVVHVHEDRMDGLDEKISRLSVSTDARFDLMQAQREKDRRCVDVDVAPGGFARLGSTGLMVAVDSMQRDDQSFDALVVNALGMKIASATIRVGSATVLVEDMPPGKARATKLYAPDGQKTVVVCAEDIAYSYIKP
jgi:hypothetical protein